MSRTLVHDLVASAMASFVSSAAREKRPPCILLADDDVETRSMLGGFLHSHGFEVEECSDGLGLLLKLGEVDHCSGKPRFSLVISDIRMPVLTGLEVLEGIGHCSDVPPFILLTAFGDEKTRRAAYQLGADAVIDKPCELDSLLQHVQNVVPSESTSGTQSFVEPQGDGHYHRKSLDSTSMQLNEEGNSDGLSTHPDCRG